MTAMFLLLQYNYLLKVYHILPYYFHKNDPYHPELSTFFIHVQAVLLYHEMYRYLRHLQVYRQHNST